MTIKVSRNLQGKTIYTALLSISSSKKFKDDSNAHYISRYILLDPDLSIIS
jgi:hypothetical protein